MKFTTVWFSDQGVSEDLVRDPHLGKPGFLTCSSVDNKIVHQDVAM